MNYQNKIEKDKNQRKKPARLILFIIALPVVLSIFQACSSKVKEVASSMFIPKDTLAQVLTEIHLADAYLSVRRTDKLSYERRDLYLSILKKYHISQARFDTTIQHYSNNVIDYEEIYEGVLKKISEMEANAAVQAKDLREEALDSLTLKTSVNEAAADSVSESKKAFLKKAMEKRDENEEKMLRAKKAPRL